MPPGCNDRSALPGENPKMVERRFQALSARAVLGEPKDAAAMVRTEVVRTAWKRRRLKPVVSVCAGPDLGIKSV